MASGINELLRRMAVLFGILMGLAMFFYVAPAVISVTAVDWAQEQADELKSYSGYVSKENKRLSQLPLDEYIREKTVGKVTAVDSSRWTGFFEQVGLASSGKFAASIYGNRVGDDIKDEYWSPSFPTEVYFKPDEIPFAEWGLIPHDGRTIYISASQGGKTAYLQLQYQDYSTSVGAMSSPYRVAPGWLYHPYRNIGIGLMVLGLMLYIFLPRRKKQPEDIAYSASSRLAGDLAALILFLPFFGLPFLINGGTVQAITGLWPITAVMWFLASIAAILFYYNAWSASFRIELTPEALYLITFRGVRECRFHEMSAVDVVSLRNPGWFRKLFLAIAFLSMLGGRSSAQPAGSALLTATAAYGGLEIKGRTGKPIYIWFTDQNGGVIIDNFERVPEAIEAAGVRINRDAREAEGFAMLM